MRALSRQAKWLRAQGWAATERYSGVAECERDPLCLAECEPWKQGVFSGWGGQQDRCRAEPQAEERPSRRTAPEPGRGLQVDPGGCVGWQLTKMGGRKSPVAPQRILAAVLLSSPSLCPVAEAA